MIVRQCMIRRPIDGVWTPPPKDAVSGWTYQMCWLDDRPDLKRNIRVTLRPGDDTLWQVVSIGKEFDLTKMQIHSQWHVGGLRKGRS